MKMLFVQHNKSLFVSVLNGLLLLGALGAAQCVVTCAVV